MYEVHLKQEHSDQSDLCRQLLASKMGKGGGICSSSETERLQDEERRYRALQERNEAERERVANLSRLNVNFISPPPATKFEFHVEETVGGALKTLAPHYGVNEPDVPSLQLEFSDTILTPEQQLTAAGLCDESLCHVLGVEAVLAGYAIKANTMDIVEAAFDRRWEDMQIICKYAPEKVSDKGRVSHCSPTHCCF